MRTNLLLAMLLLAGCDQVKERMGFPDPARVEADGKAIGGACRNAGRGLEDCFHLNPDASKAAIYAGWKDMSEYMAKNNLPAIEPTVAADTAAPAEATAKPKGKKAGGEEEAEKKPGGKHDAAH